MKIIVSFLISFFFVCFSPGLILSGAVDECFEINNKNAAFIARQVAPQNVGQKLQLHPRNWDFKSATYTSAIFCDQSLYMPRFSSLGISNFISSGAKIYQHIAST